MRRLIAGLACVLLTLWLTPVAVAAEFTPLTPMAAPKVIGCAEPYSGMGAHLLVDGEDGPLALAYASNIKGTETFVDFDFGRPTRIGAIKHVDRRNIATVDTALLTFSDQPDFSNPIATAEVDHVNTPGGITFAQFEPATARYVRWQVTATTVHNCPGGIEITFFAAGDPEPTPKQTSLSARAFPALIRDEGKLLLPVEVTIDYPYAESIEATLEVTGSPPQTVALQTGKQTVEIPAAVVETERSIDLALKVAGQTVAQGKAVLKPVRRWELHILPHSHVDIGFTHVQTEVEHNQWKFFEMAVELANKTADYPPEARFKWNVEVLWAVDSYLKQATDEKRQAFLEAARKGQMHIDGLYGNELTGLCRPEELLWLTKCAEQLRTRYGFQIDAAMISDVPGYSWGLVPVMAQSGIKYLSMGPNPWHRIGRTLLAWGDRPYYWVSPSGKDKVLCWMAGKSYAWFHPGLMGSIKGVKPESFFRYLNELDDAGYPYDMVQLRYSISGDNGPPDPELPEYVKNWNEKYAYPKLVISTTSDLFHKFEERYGDKIPEVRGDFTPYWEDGAGSSARETALAREAAERLVQAQTLWALHNPREFPHEQFYTAWRNISLYDEHTWGAHCSISQPDSEFTRSQWAIKQAYAVDAQKQSHELLATASGEPAHQASAISAVQVFNTSSWARTGLITLLPECSKAGDLVKGPDGQAVASQRLSDGSLAFLATDVPPFGAKRYAIEAGTAAQGGKAKASDATVGNGQVTVTLDGTTGAIAKLTAQGISGNLVDTNANLGLNDYFYVAGRDAKDPKRNGPVTIRVKEAGPLVASLIVESDAPGCRKLTREIRVVDSADHVQIVNVVDKEDVREAEAVHFGFAFDVPGGVMRMDIPWAVIRPEEDQMPGACKNYFPVQRWVDLSNEQFGVTWATLDAPMVELGRITMDVLPDKNKPQNWIRRLKPTGTFYSYVMNNYWETNYKASQDGPTTFRYAIRPHAKSYSAIEAARFGIGQSQPLISVPATEKTPKVVAPLVEVSPAEVIVTALKPSDDGKAWIVRLFGAGGKAAKVELAWRDPQPKRITLSSPSEQPGKAASGKIDVPAWGIVTVRAELPE